MPEKLDPEADWLAQMHAHLASARAAGSRHVPVFSPADAIAEAHIGPMSEAGFRVVVYTVNAPERICALIDLGVDGIISDRPDLLRRAAEGYDGPRGSLLTADGLIDPARLDAQGHRGARGLRPENTLPAMECALDSLMTTLETDVGVTADGVAVLNHDPRLELTTCRRADVAARAGHERPPVRSLTTRQIQENFIGDGLPGASPQSSDRRLSPASTAFAAARDLPDPYLVPTLDQLFDFVGFYADDYLTGAGAGAPDAERRSLNAVRVRFSIETKVDLSSEESGLTHGPQRFVDAVSGPVDTRGLHPRVDIQSFDERTLLLTHEQHPTIRTVLLAAP